MKISDVTPAQGRTTPEEAGWYIAYDKCEIEANTSELVFWTVWTRLEAADAMGAMLEAQALGREVAEIKRWTVSGKTYPRNLRLVLIAPIDLP